MTKTFTEKGIEYLLVKIDNPFANDLSKIKFDAPLKEYAIISLLKDITEEQAKEICSYPNDFPWGNDVFTDKKWFLAFLRCEHGIDNSLNWLLLKKI